MKWYEIIAQIVGLGFWTWFGLVFLGGGITAGIILFPLGVLPIIFIGGGILYFIVDDFYQKKIGCNIGGGITEFPLEASMCLNGKNNNKIGFSDDGRSLVLDIETRGCIDLSTPTNLKMYLKEVKGSTANVNLDWVDKYIIETVRENKESKMIRVVVSIPDDVVLTDKYINHEIENIGCVFVLGGHGNDIRYLGHPQGERRTERKDGMLLVYIHRLQIVPGFLFEKQKTMSEKQITRNIKNRLWNRVDVKCISLDEDNYCGVILDV